MVEETQEGTVKVTQENLIQTVQNLVDAMPVLLDKMDTLVKTTVKKSAGLFGGKRTKTAIKDTKTGTIYPSKAAMGKALAKEFGGEITDNFVYYKIMAKADAGRFVEASQEEAEAAWKKQDELLQKSVDEANKELAEKEKAAKAKVKGK